jgi:hypothetical protein
MLFLTTDDTDHTELKDPVTATASHEAGAPDPRLRCPVRSVGWRGQVRRRWGERGCEPRENGLQACWIFCGRDLGFVAPHRGGSPQAFGGRPCRPAEVFWGAVFKGG